jgi:hypothetical protein
MINGSALLARPGADSRNGCFPESVSRDEIMRPERPKRERGQGWLAAGLSGEPHGM